jgi:hypothetical protein
MTTPAPAPVQAPKKRGPKPKPAAELSDAKPRTIRLDEARWRKLQRLGRAWLEWHIDAER